MNVPLKVRRFVLTVAVCGIAIAPIAASPVSPFASQALSYYPAWGFYVNCYLDEEGLPTRQFGDPNQAVGAPNGEGTNPAGNPDHVTTLGAFGGSITLKFDHTVKNDPNNPFGMDAIIFGNAFRTSGNVFMEAGTIEISRDSNGNGIADDPWYIIPGSHMAGPPSSAWTTKQYDKVNAAYAPALKSYYPDKTSLYGAIWYPTYPDHVTLGAYKLPNSLAGTSSEAAWGYADCSPTLRLGDMNGDNAIEDAGILPEEFYTSPDDSTSAGITGGSAGGDAFDISWAMNAAGTPANLDGFDFIRITSAVDASVGGPNECSPEIDGVADASPAPETIVQAKGHANGCGVRLSMVTVTAVYPGEFYVRDAAYSGIKIRSSLSVTPGDRVNVIGTIAASGGERYICTVRQGGAIEDAYVRVVDHDDQARGAVGMPNSHLGGKSLNADTPGVDGGVEINNLGLLVRTWGAVKSVGSNYFCISDGSLPEGQTLKVSPGVLSIQNPRMVQITGISSNELVNGVRRRVIRPLPQDGIIEIQ